MTSRFERFVFAPVHVATAQVFRAALAAFAVIHFWPRREALRLRFHRISGLPEIYDAVFFTWPYWVVVVIALAVFASSARSRAAGLVTIALLAPLLLSERFYVSRLVTFTSVLAVALVPLPRLGRSRAAVPPIRPIPIWPIRLVQIQLSALYGWNALVKATPDYLSGDVLVAMSESLYNFEVDLSDGSLHIGFLTIPAWLCAAGTIGVEGFLAIGFWVRRLRWWAAATGVAFHLSLEFVIEVGFLDWTAMFLYLAFLLPFDATHRRLAESPGVGTLADHRSRAIPDR